MAAANGVTGGLLPDLPASSYGGPLSAPDRTGPASTRARAARAGYGDPVSGAVVRVRGLRAQFGERVVLDGLDVSADRGEVVALTGVNGAGKSTLLRCVAGLHRPAAGQVLVLGAPPRDSPQFWRAVAMAADEPAWYPGLTVGEHLELIRLVHEPLPAGHPSVEDVLADVGLAGKADDIPPVLSSGQRQRLLLAAALARPSALLLLDEPEKALDPAFRERLARLLKAHAERGGCVLMATHDLGMAGQAGARRVDLPAGAAAAAVR